ncbi:MAG: aldo/keto reductase [Chloroflexi bacterium]|nr:aldo/keto reductase [Chloroflexota bacterium]MYK61846.1 aldo/keto reductase [Chloroflexota bacterium]
MQKRTLGRTGHDSTVVSFGTYAVGYVDQDAADRAIQLVLDAGVNHFDIAPTYGHAMERVAPWMPEIRKQGIFVGAKTAVRDRDGAWRDVESIMRRMNIEEFDLFQLHSVGNMDQLELATASGGSLETLVEMREQGLTKWLGITGHGPEVPATILEALKRFDFDTVMFPLNPAAARDPGYRKVSEALLAECEERDIGVQTIKMIARGGWGDGEKQTNTWYDPHREQSDIDASLWWVLSHGVHTAPSCGEISLLPRVLDAAERFKPLSEDQMRAVEKSQRPPLPLPALAIPAAA